QASRQGGGRSMTDSTKGSTFRAAVRLLDKPPAEPIKVMVGIPASSTSTAPATADAPVAGSATANVRSLDAIAKDIHRRKRDDLSAVGNPRREAKATCRQGEWLPWLKEEFGWSEDSAERYMSVARLGERFRPLRNLLLPKTVFYYLVKQDKAPPAAMPE